MGTAYKPLPTVPPAPKGRPQLQLLRGGADAGDSVAGSRPGGGRPLARFEGLPNGGPARTFTDVSQDFAVDRVRGMGGIQRVDVRFGNPGDEHYLSASVRDGVMQFNDIRALDSALREQGVHGRDLMYSMAMRLTDEGVNVHTIDFSFGTPKGMSNINNNYDAFIAQLDVLKQSGQVSNEMLMHAMKNSPSAKVSAELGYELTSVQPMRGFIFGQMTRKGGMPHFTRLGGGGMPGATTIMDLGPGGSMGGNFDNLIHDPGMGRAIGNRFDPAHMGGELGGNPYVQYATSKGGSGGGGGIGDDGIKVKTRGWIVHPDETRVRNLSPMLSSMEFPGRPDLDILFIGNAEKAQAASKWPTILLNSVRHDKSFTPHFISAQRASSLAEPGGILQIALAAHNQSLIGRGMTDRAMVSTMLKLIQKDKAFRAFNLPTIHFSLLLPEPNPAAALKFPMKIPPVVSWFEQWGYKPTTVPPKGPGRDLLGNIIMSQEQMLLSPQNFIFRR